MFRFRLALLSATLCSGLALTAAAQPAPAATPAAAAPAQPRLLFDPQQLPAFHGKVAQYSLTPRGGVDGLVLDDGTQVHVNPRLSTELVFLVKPGDTVTVHGVKAESGSLILALSVVNDAGGKTLVDGILNRRMHDEPVVAQGRIKAQLHNRRDELDGVVLDDGSQIRLWPGAARRIAAQLAPGQTIYASGFGRTTLLGKLVLPRMIGPTEAEATELQRPAMAMGGMGEMGGGQMRERWMHGPGRSGPGMEGPGMRGHEMHPGVDAPPPPNAAPNK
jgi:hypothetical protein